VSKDHVEIDEERHLEAHKGHKELLNGPYLHIIVVEFNQFLDGFLLEYLLLLSIFQLIKELITQRIIIVVQPRQIHKFHLNRPLNDSIIPCPLLFHQLLVEARQTEPRLYFSNAYGVRTEAALGYLLDLFSLL